MSMTCKAICIHQPGGADQLVWEDVDVASPGADQVLVRHTAVGLNYIDVYQRSGMYPIGDMPKALGMEGAGVIEAAGDGVNDFAVGDRVAYAMDLGSYCEKRVMGTGKLVKLPDNIEDQTAAAMMLQGMTARYLLKSSYPVQAGDTVLVMAAAGGVGSILTQWATHLGASVIGCVGSAAKAELATANGAAHVINYKDEDITLRVKDITDGQGVAASYDSIGLDTLEASLGSLRPNGFLISFGSASEPITSLNIGQLAAGGSLYIQRPTLATYTRNRELLNEVAGDLFDVVGKGIVKINIGQTYALSDTAQAHRDLEDRKTTGSTVLLP